MTWPSSLNNKCVNFQLTLLELISLLIFFRHPHLHFLPSYISRASLVVQLVKNPPAMWETWVWYLGWEDTLEKGKATHSSILAWRVPWTVHGVAKSWTQLSDFHFHCISSKRNTCANTHTHTPSQVAIRSFSCLSQPANISLWMSLLHSIFQEYLHFQRKK